MSARTDAAPAGHPDPAQGYYSNRRRDIELVLPPHAGSVLEVGCGAGETLRWLKATGRCTSTTGIEIVSAAGELARAHVDRVLVGDAERLIDTELAARSFDLVSASTSSSTSSTRGRSRGRRRTSWFQVVSSSRASPTSGTSAS